MNATDRLLVFAGVIVIGLLVYLLGPVLTPFLISALLAYMAAPFTDRLERLLAHIGLGRSSAVLVTFLLMVLALALILLLMMPLVGREMAMLLDRLPTLAEWAQFSAMPWLQQHLGINIAGLNATSIGKLLSQYTGTLSSVARDAISSGSAVVGWLINIVLVPVVTFYLLRDWHGLTERAQDILPRRYAAGIVRLTHECDEVLAAFFRGQLLVMLSLGLLYAVGLWAIGLQDALAVGVIAGVLSFVPYLGVISGVLLALLSALVQGMTPVLGLGVLAVFAIGQMMEGFVLTPRMVGERIGLHPLVVIFAIMAGGALFGFVGVLLALPVSAAIKVLLGYGYARYKRSHLYQGDQSGGHAH
ncbi:MAG: hypothetical protein B7Z66_07500 [Chromatiales bacterium 21-64-14]|nr:MAG: hypothetical protein B7Z66_07500 [Chromatiales bacterium 21-64-14]HQU15423.1 AI-2E family transporter [Gammaproteobacteria bacterium]